ncbi:unnamed protein product [Sphagnum troendelagicum]
MMTMVSNQQRGKEHFVIYKGTIVSWYSTWMINDDDEKEQQHFCHLQRHYRELITRWDDNHHYDDAELEPKGKEHFVIHEGTLVS